MGFGGAIAIAIAIAAADVDARLAGRKTQPVADRVDGRLDSLGRRFAASRPQPVMDVRAPYPTIDGIELVVVIRDRSWDARSVVPVPCINVPVMLGWWDGR